MAIGGLGSNNNDWLYGSYPKINTGNYEKHGGSESKGIGGVKPEIETPALAGRGIERTATNPLGFDWHSLGKFDNRDQAPVYGSDGAYYSQGNFQGKVGERLNLMG